jgi:hypothetical protein
MAAEALLRRLNLQYRASSAFFPLNAIGRAAGSACIAIDPDKVKTSIGQPEPPDNSSRFTKCQVDAMHAG